MRSIYIRGKEEKEKKNYITEVASEEEKRRQQIYMRAEIVTIFRAVRA